MPQKKSFWKRLLSGEEERTGLSAAQACAIRNTLHDEYGVSISCGDASAEEMAKRGFRRLTGDELARISQLFQYIPQIAAKSAARKAIKAAFRASTEGTYRVRLPAGMHLCHSHLTSGAYRAVGLSNSTNRIAGNAELFVNDAVLSVSNAPQLAVGIFNAASMVTGQYFMAQVNARLTALEASVGKLKQLLDAQRHGELKAAAQELEDIREKAEYILADTERTNEAISQIHDVQRIAGKSMNTSQELVENELKPSEKGDRAETIKARLAAVIRYLFEYRYAAQIYGIATLLEVQMRNITDPDELAVFREQINRRVDQYKADQAEAERRMAAYLDMARVLNGRSVLQWAASGLAGLAETLAAQRHGAAKGIGSTAFSLVNGLFSDRQKARKAEIVNQSHSEFAALGDTALLDSPDASIDLFIEAVGREIEYVKIGDEYYTNLPEA